MRVVGGFVWIAQQSDGLDHRVLRVALARVDNVVNRFHAPKVRMVGLSVLRRNPALVSVRIPEKLSVAKIATQEAELPQVVGDVLANVTNCAVRANDDLCVFVRTRLLFGWRFSACLA